MIKLTMRGYKKDDDERHKDIYANPLHITNIRQKLYDGWFSVIEYTHGEASFVTETPEEIFALMRQSASKDVRDMARVDNYAWEMVAT